MATLSVARVQLSVWPALRRPTYSTWGRKYKCGSKPRSTPPPALNANWFEADPLTETREPPAKACTKGLILKGLRRISRGPNMYVSVFVDTPLGEAWYPPKSPTNPKKRIG